MLVVGVAASLLLIGVALALATIGLTTSSSTQTNTGHQVSSQSYLTTFTRSCNGAIVFCGISSAVATGSTTTVVVYQLINSNTTTITENRVLFSNSSTTAYYNQTLYHVVLNYSTTYTVVTDNTTTTVFANLGGASGPRFELQEFGLSAYNSLVGGSYLFGYVVFNSSVAPTSIQYLVNGTGGDSQAISRPGDILPGQSYSDVWKSGAGYNLVSGHAYTITFIITYEDGVSQSVSIILIAN